MKKRLGQLLARWAKRLLTEPPPAELLAMIPFLDVNPWVPPPPKLIRTYVYESEPVSLKDGRVVGGWRRYKILLHTQDGGNHWVEAKREQVWE